MRKRKKNEYSIIQTLVQNSLYCKTVKLIFLMNADVENPKAIWNLRWFFIIKPITISYHEFNNLSDKSNSIHNPLILLFFFFRHPKNRIKMEGEYSILAREWRINRGCRRWFYFRITHTGCSMLGKKLFKMSICTLGSTVKKLSDGFCETVLKLFQKWRKKDGQRKWSEGASLQTWNPPVRVADGVQFSSIWPSNRPNKDETLAADVACRPLLLLFTESSNPRGGIF